MGNDPMRSHRRAEGVAWGVALLGVLIALPAFMIGGTKGGFGVLVAALVLACFLYYK